MQRSVTCCNLSFFCLLASQLNGRGVDGGPRYNSIAKVLFIIHRCLGTGPSHAHQFTTALELERCSAQWRCRNRPSGSDELRRPCHGAGFIFSGQRHLRAPRIRRLARALCRDSRERIPGGVVRAVQVYCRYKICAVFPLRRLMNHDFRNATASQCATQRCRGIGADISVQFFILVRFL